MCSAEACLEEFHLDNYNPVSRAPPPWARTSFILLILLHNTARGEVHWVLIKRHKEIINWGMQRAVNQSPPISRDDDGTTSVNRVE